MDTADIQRAVQPDGTVVLSAGPGTFRYRSLRPGLLHISVAGDDNGQFGSRLIDEIAAVLARERPLEIFVDATAGSMPGIGVNGRWARFLMTHRNDITRVHILAGSRTTEVALAIAKRLSPAGHLIELYTRREAFEASLQAVR